MPHATAKQCLTCLLLPFLLLLLQKLFSYISGANAEGKRIPMTSPVSHHPTVVPTAGPGRQPGSHSLSHSHSVTHPLLSLSLSHSVHSPTLIVALCSLTRCSHTYTLSLTHSYCLTLSVTHCSHPLTVSLSAACPLSDGRSRPESSLQMVGTSPGLPLLSAGTHSSAYACKQSTAIITCM